ncbi:zinc-binding alcohol dehydrogenase family protein [Latilactobacillus sakei]
MITQTKAVGFYQHLPISSTNSFENLTVQVPELKAHDLLVRVTGVSVNPVDTFVRGGSRSSKLSHPKIIGWDAFGTVINTGNEVSLFKKGDHVWYAGDFRRSGSDSQFQAVDERIVGKAPNNLVPEKVAAIPLVGLTAYESLFEKLEITWNVQRNKGKTILIINGSGGVGSIAIQLAKLAGLTIIATASKPDSVEWVNKLNADYIIDHHKDLVYQIHEKNIKYVDYVLNLNNLDAHWNEIAEIIRPDGRVAATTENHKLIDLQKLTKKRVTFAWEWMYSKSYYQTVDMVSQNYILNRISELFESNKLKSIMTKTYAPINAENLKRAHKDVESGHMIGKVTITGWEE